MRTEAAQRKLKKCVHKHKKAASEARWETDQAYVALGNLHTQMEQVDQQRAAAQEARVDDQTVLADYGSSWRPLMPKRSQLCGSGS